MSREKETFRDHVAALHERFGDVELISVVQAADYLGVHRTTLARDKKFPFVRVGRQRRVSIVNLARWLAV